MKISDYFLGKLEFVLGKWPDDVKWSVQQLASYTTFESDEVAGYLNLALKTRVGPDDKVCREDVSMALEILLSRQNSLSEENETRKMESLDKLRKKIDRYAAGMEWVRGYQSVTYYLGQMQKSLANDEITELVSQILRFGCKAGRSTQELFPWLNSRYEDMLKAGESEQKARLVDIIDLVDAYGNYFYQDTNGRKQILAFMETIRSCAEKASLTDSFEQVLTDLGES